jgi:tetratricopeptide (TPR) repeat protein
MNAIFSTSSPALRPTPPAWEPPLALREHLAASRITRSTLAALDEAVRNVQIGRADDAEVSLRELARRRPNLASVHAHLGLVSRHLGHLEDAVAALEEAVRLLPDHAGYQNELGLTLRMLGRYERAQAAFERAIHIDARRAAALVDLNLPHERAFDPSEQAALYEVPGAALLRGEAAIVERWVMQAMRRSGRSRSPSLARPARGAAAIRVDVDLDQLERSAAEDTL